MELMTGKKAGSARRGVGNLRVRSRDAPLIPLREKADESGEQGCFRVRRIEELL
jgi:hypothetical protein